MTVTSILNLNPFPRVSPVPLDHHYLAALQHANPNPDLNPNPGLKPDPNPDPNPLDPESHLFPSATRVSRLCSMLSSTSAINPSSSSV